ncbi:MAG TPA: nicotinate-nucleotide adenylyltransferase [Candidatus Tenderia electrophaga]|uniref:Probable nicotinate-nucleotide adenylyltransferase n=1 Tax=Candidatus Tenderia electrophaga TaxID=1748243 RepID=A0A832J4D6_9GAMM|nr:nicotinate-nucleotide adenylyltransferase [Candidatus Tenderia electrophaga]
MIGVFGGTFDPVHFGHLRPLLEVQQALGLAEVRLIPCYIPPHRGVPGASAEQRLAMLQLAAADTPGFVVDQRELQRGGPSYMIDTLQSLRDELGAEQALCLILGLDAFVALDGWHQWSRLIELAHIVVMQRPGGVLPNTGAVAELVDQTLALDVAELQQQPAGRVYFQSVTQLDISATAIREQLSHDQDIRFLMPDSVRHYIETHGLYKY